MDEKSTYNLSINRGQIKSNSENNRKRTVCYLIYLDGFENMVG